MLFVCAGAARAQAPEQLLAWVDRADASRMFADSAHAGHTHFLVVCGYACYTPGLGAITRAHCYAGEATDVVIDPTGDVVMSARQDTLKAKAAALAEAYNRLTVADLDRRGLKQCPSGERWEDYWSALDSLAKTIPAHPYESFVLALTAGPRHHPDFQFHVQDARDLSAALAPTVCALVARYGIQRTVRFAVTTGNINDHPKVHPGFSCRAGRVAT